jgi:sarcosine oxidase/L-pipecolate oxidase
MSSSFVASPPRSILIIGSGVFGLSTALALIRRPLYSSTTITVLDRSPFPSLDGSSIDTSRIVRADYSSPAYASLATAAQAQWRKSSPTDLGGEGRYSESGLVLVANKNTQGDEYVRKSWINVQALMQAAGDVGGVYQLPDRPAIEAATGTGGWSGDWGYMNRRGGWADAEASMRWLRAQVEATGRVSFIHGEAVSLLKTGRQVHGTQLTDGRTITAKLVVLATGSWTGKLVDLRGRATATGQVMAYVPLTEAEQARLGGMPVLLNMSSGLFIIPPANRVLKVARHAYGYANPQRIPNPDAIGYTGASGNRQGEEEREEELISVSLPRTTTDDPALQIPAEGALACREALAEMIPWLASRPFSKTRICWYLDTPKGDFLITYHPRFKGLFLATGGSGHAFKFLPALGECVVDCIEGRCPEAFKDIWGWTKDKVDKVVTQDGSRGGMPGLVLEEEIKSKL